MHYAMQLLHVETGSLTQYPIPFLFQNPFSCGVVPNFHAICSAIVNPIHRCWLAFFRNQRYEFLHPPLYNVKYRLRPQLGVYVIYELLIYLILILLFHV